MSRTLTARILEAIFPELAQGFLLDRKQRLGETETPTEEDLADIFGATVAVLYRLLVLLYAEARGLLPNRETSEDDASLIKIKDVIADSETCSIQDTAWYDRFLALFQTLGDGGLFCTPRDESECPTARFLRKHKVPDRHLASALHALVHDPDEERRDQPFIDYAALPVRWLGSSYESLLDCKLKQAGEEQTIQNARQGAKHTPLSQTKFTRGKRTPVVRSKGDLYLGDNGGSRKASGSYYTPDAIVKYVVANTVGPLLQEKFDALQSDFHEATRTWVSEGRQSREYLALLDSLFDFRVLDPAMGSGHFLVETGQFIAEHVHEFLKQLPFHRVNFALHMVRQRILRCLREQAVTIDPSKYTDANLLKWQVIKRCIYGIDLDPMAVSLACGSIWTCQDCRLPSSMATCAAAMPCWNPHSMNWIRTGVPPTLQGSTVY